MFTPILPTFDIGEAITASVAAAIMYPPEAPISPIIPTTGNGLFINRSAILCEATGVPPGELISIKTAWIELSDSAAVIKPSTISGVTTNS